MALFSPDTKALFTGPDPLQLNCLPEFSQIGRYQKGLSFTPPWRR